MPKLFSVASWNVEHFAMDADRVRRVIAFLDAQKPDVFGLYEVEGSVVFGELVARMPGYTFQITEGPQTQEILVGIRKTVTAFITQKVEFKSGTTHMRPGQLVTVVKDGVNYGLLFLHLASGNDPRGMGLRDDMLERAFDFRAVLDRTEGGPGQARYVFLGDLNTMGMKYPYDKSIDATIELAKWDAYAAKAKVGMKRLVKTHEASWTNGSQSSLPPSNLDHVFASTNLKFRNFRRADGQQAQVAVRGWVQEKTPAAQDKWIANYSDHSLLYFEVHS